MNRIIIGVAVVILGLRLLSFAGDLEWEDVSRGNLDFRAILVNPDNPRIILSGSKNTVLKSEDAGENWRSVYSVKGQNNAINLLLSGKDKESVFSATGNGLFYSGNGGKSWKRIFKGKSLQENECIALAILPQAIYLGTKAGLFISGDKGRSWQRSAGEIGKSNILAITSHLAEEGYMYVACVDGIFRTQGSGKTWERIFVAHPVENGKEEEEEAEDRDEEERFSAIKYLSCDPGNPNNLYLATSSGVYKSEDRGTTWKMLPDYGLLSRDVKFILVSAKGVLYAATKSGIFVFKEERWRELSFRLAVNEVRVLALDKENNLYAACDKGLFRARIRNFRGQETDNLREIYYNQEPSIKDVQQAAIKYAEVEPQKISRWRKQAAKKALLPQLSANVGRNVTDLWHWETGSSTRTGDDTLLQGQGAIEWDVSVSWDLGEIIWNNDQTSIDTRSRLMVQLRDDILDEVTKLYFERIRVKAELENLSIEDRIKRFDKELRIRELTASIDALTGGYFSEHLKEKS